MLARNLLSSQHERVARKALLSSICLCAEKSVASAGLIAGGSHPIKSYRNRPQSEIPWECKTVVWASGEVRFFKRSGKFFVITVLFSHLERIFLSFEKVIVINNAQIVFLSLFPTQIFVPQSFPFLFSFNLGVHSRKFEKYIKLSFRGKLS